MENWNNLGKKTNQNFVQIPHAVFINQIQYKAELQGITVLLQEESYTSKCSFLDNESIEKHDKYKGKRIKRGLFKTEEKYLINSDIHGSLNIIRKAIPNFAVGKNEIQDFVVSPRLVTLWVMSLKKRFFMIFTYYVLNYQNSILEPLMEIFQQEAIRTMMEERV